MFDLKKEIIEIHLNPLSKLSKKMSIIVSVLLDVAASQILDCKPLDKIRRFEYQSKERAI